MKHAGTRLLGETGLMPTGRMSACHCLHEYAHFCTPSTEKGAGTHLALLLSVKARNPAGRLQHEPDWYKGRAAAPAYVGSLDGDPQGSIMRTVVPEETTVDVGLDVEGDGEALADTQQTSMAFNNIELA
eukprot:CAMPEP_0117676224 /NCGR_PEP_ID=MMETSP0804-20121206/16041_1 /TAXON_ID=1074897 /ORGANISM="Tetraselmis astigmatica, Strain CCMP880" /LENGTH=128 /DNA_ID=CAMNT_0005485313 /DNA_START=178 /DNA_END=564 /DNA_ORIENTATION=-